jgi:chaperonin cofactor prefoldin
MKSTKESLTKDNKTLESKVATLQQTVERLESNDRRLRRQFTDILGRSYVYSGDYSWEQIFCEIGKLLSQKTQNTLSEKLSSLEQRVSEMQNQPKPE